jgi:hypothetical protein
MTLWASSLQELFVATNPSQCPPSSLRQQLLPLTDTSSYESNEGIHIPPKEKTDSFITGVTVLKLKNGWSHYLYFVIKLCPPVSAVLHVKCSQTHCLCQLKLY